MAKLSKDQQFFYDNYIKFAKELAKQGDKRLLELLNEQKQNKDKLMNKIANILLDYKIKDNILTLEDTEKIKLYSDYNKWIDEVIGGENKNELNNLSDTLITMASDKWNSNNYLLQLGLSTHMAKCSDSIVNKIINTKIDGKKYSDRLYDNKVDVAKRLKQNILDLFNGNIDVNSIKDVLNKTYNLNANNTKRLVSNEIARVNQSINDKWIYNNNYVNYVMWSATLESNTCAECGELDGQVWGKDKDHPTPLEDTHPLCKCTLIALIDKDYRPTTRLDNETKENISWQTYKEWKENK